MKYVHVLKSNLLPSGQLDIIPSILKHTDNVLVPLTGVFGVVSPGVGRIEDFHAVLLILSPNILFATLGFGLTRAALHLLMGQFLQKTSAI